MSVVYFGKSDLISEGTNSDIDTVEEDIVSDTDIGDLSFSQLSMYVTTDLGTHTTVDLRVYCRNAVGGTWHQLIKRDVSTGIIEDDYFRFNSSTPANTVIDLPISACMAVKVTGKGIGGANAAVTVRLMGRSN